MKARDIKKKLLDDYENATLEYKQLIQARHKRIDEQQIYIRVIEAILLELFGITKKLNFSRATEMEEWNAKMFDTIHKISKESSK